MACPLSQPCRSRNIRLISCVREFTACTVRVLLHIAKVVLRFGLQSCFSVCRFCPSNNSNSSTDATRIDIFRQPGCETSVQQTREEVGLSWTSVSAFRRWRWFVRLVAVPSNGGRACFEKHSHLPSTLTGGKSRMVQFLCSMGIRKTTLSGAESVDSKSSTPHTPSGVLFQGHTA